VRHDLKGVGTQAVSLLERILSARKTGETLDAESLVITPELMVRDSSRLP
jgi:DNA-binding LacI/PurR family transcriptional regulator